MGENILWLDGLVTRGIRPGLDSILSLTNALDNPQSQLRTIHVAGSDGKGSVCCMMESVLMTAGYRVGMFCSPHILKVNECIRIDGRDVDDDSFDRALGKVREASESVGCECTNFEAMTACAFLMFMEGNVDIAIIEVGMGGREDATNIIIPEVSVINNISLEHTAFLGDTLEEIAYAKAGIMKPGVPCVTINRGSVLDVLHDCAERTGCELISVDHDDIEMISNGIDGLEFRYKCKEYRAGIPGSCQARNAALAIEALMQLKDSQTIAPFIQLGLSEARWPFRLQRIDNRTILDVTHTRKGAEYLSKDVAEIYGKVILVTAMLDDKDLEGVAELMSKVATKVLVSSPNSPRAASAERLASVYRKHHPDVTVYDSVGEAMEQALKNDGYILVTGSFRTVEDCLRWLETR